MILVMSSIWICSQPRKTHHLTNWFQTDAYKNLLKMITSYLQKEITKRLISLIQKRISSIKQNKIKISKHSAC